MRLGIPYLMGSLDTMTRFGWETELYSADKVDFILPWLCIERTFKHSRYLSKASKDVSLVGHEARCPQFCQAMYHLPASQT
jgi:hypothetical protein